ncbi:hypothetical protein ACHGLA_19145 [Streptomyces sp. YH02]|uniref:hypothetical protein n=1 Tax=Streptomyces sp. YH02 TaxID=3256999 RepID=UPI00375782BE
MSVASSVLIPYASYLRVYEPLAAFPEPERTHWDRYARRPRTPGAQEELRRSLADLLPTPPVPVPVHESGEAFVARLDGVVVICPWRTRLRGWLALQELAGQFPEPVLDAMLPPVVRVQVESDYERWLSRNPDARPWIRTAVWQVPLRWFALFGDEDREYEPGERPSGAGTSGAGASGAVASPAGAGGQAAGGPAGGGPAGGGPGKAPVLRYRTTMAQARRRLARALRALRESIDDGPMTEGLIEVGRWLEEFHPRALVELDFGGLVHAVPEEWLAADRSAAQLAEGIAALRAGDGERASDAYGRLAERWRTVRDLRFAN